jgi:hypothetical protein
MISDRSQGLTDVLAHTKDLTNLTNLVLFISEIYYQNEFSVLLLKYLALKTSKILTK